MYRGYIATNNKKALQKFKNGDGLLTLEQAEQLDEYSGILSEDAVLIDIDDGAQATKLYEIIRSLGIKCKVYQTNRGAHFMFYNGGRFKSNKTHCKLAIGLEADIKLGHRASYQVLKQNGVLREVIYDTGEYTVAPAWLLPVETKISVRELGEGDGRNDALFRLILPLQSAGLSVEEIKECIRLINDWILKAPLNDSELQMILREDAFAKKGFFDGKTFKFDEFAKFLIEEHKIIKINGVLHAYMDGIYVRDCIEHLMISHIPDLSRARRVEVLSYLNVVIRDNTELSAPNIIAFKNGVYDTRLRVFREFSSDDILVNRIPWNYSEDAYSELLDTTLNQWTADDKELRVLLEELVGFLFYRANQLGKAFVLVGNKSNGKSTFLGLLQTLLGRENTSSLDLRELGDRFKTAELFGKLANIGDDIGDGYISDSSVFKKLATGDRVTAERKGEQPFQFDSYSKLIFSANTVPRIKDRTGAVMRRLMIVPFTGVFGEGVHDPYLKYKLEDESCMEYLVLLGVRGLERVLEHNGFSKSARIEEKIREYEMENNPLLGFLDEVEKVENEPCAAVYDKYLAFCYANNFKPLGRNNFYTEVSSKTGLDVIRKRCGGERVRVFA